MEKINKNQGLKLASIISKNNELIIFVITVLGVGISYVLKALEYTYTLGKYNTLGIPSYFIDKSTSFWDILEILLNIIILPFVLFLYRKTYKLIYNLEQKRLLIDCYHSEKSSKIKNYSLYTFLVLLISLLICFLNIPIVILQTKNQSVLISIILCFILTIFEGILSYSSFKSSQKKNNKNLEKTPKDYFEKRSKKDVVKKVSLEEKEELDAKIHKLDTTDNFMPVIGLLSFVVIIIMLFYFFYIIGGDSIKKTDYFQIVSAENVEYAVMGNYEDKYILVEVAEEETSNIKKLIIKRDSQILMNSENVSYKMKKFNDVELQ